jgi:ribosomal protein S10
MEETNNDGPLEPNAFDRMTRSILESLDDQGPNFRDPVVLPKKQEPRTKQKDQRGDFDCDGISPA